MTTAAELITGAKLAPAQASAIRVGNTVQYAATAAGSDQSTALAITTGASRVVVTTAAASTGVRLPATRFPGDQIFVANHGANAITVYPASGDKINGLSANTGVSLAAGISRWFLCVNDATTNWVG